MAFRVHDAAKAFALASSVARSGRGSAGPMELNIPAIEGIGGSYLYLVDRYGPGKSTMLISWRFPEPWSAMRSVGLASRTSITSLIMSIAAT